ncbi:MAG: hypothetical protein DHS20C13_06680 [Thermodesulfobacteriota bacterium]|nr:MAG: hypothetical protein DHS20C13_06680 [Thermodesulfobacteriota bacterium]
MNENSPSPLVSIIIPCFNSEKYLAESIRSALDQTYKNCEIIVIDDGSTDKTADIIKSFGFSVTGIFEENRGASAARNKGTEVARGEFIQYLDSDDLLTPDSLEKKLTALRDSAYDVAYSDWQELKEDQKGNFVKGDVKSRSIQDLNSNIEIALFTQFWAPPAAYLFKSKLFAQIGGFNEKITFGEDARFVFDAARLGAKFIKVEDLGAFYRVRNKGSLSKSDPTAFLKDIYINSCEVESIWKKRGVLDADQIEALIQNYDYTARNLFGKDYSIFKKNLHSLYGVEPGFKFTWPKVAGVLSKVFGYKVANNIMKYLFPLNKHDS